MKGKADKLSKADRALLSQAVTEPTLTVQVDSHNSAVLAQLHDNVTNIHTEDYKKDPCSGRMERQAKPLKGGKN